MDKNIIFKKIKILDINKNEKGIFLEAFPGNLPLSYKNAIIRMNKKIQIRNLNFLVPKIINEIEFFLLNNCKKEKYNEKNQHYCYVRLLSSEDYNHLIHSSYYWREKLIGNYFQDNETLIIKSESLIKGEMISLDYKNFYCGISKTKKEKLGKINIYYGITIKK